MRLNANVRALGKRGIGTTLAFMLTGYLPTGDSQSYAGDGGVGIAPSALVAGDHGMFAYARSSAERSAVGRSSRA